MTDATLSVELVAWTQFQVPLSLRGRYQIDSDAIPGDALSDPRHQGDGQDLAEFAGRACYQSWGRPNAATATNEGYLGHILDVGHNSVLEHGSASFYVQGVSRSLTHELVRHRHHSYSQLSQRYVDSADAARVPPDLADHDPSAMAILDRSWAQALEDYESLVAHWTARLERERPELGATARRKAVRQAARAVMPNMTETKIVVTGNYRAWRHFVAMRAAEHADPEIRLLAVAVFRRLQDHVPNVVQDGRTRQLDDGSVVVEGIPTEES